jgi:hypothetical protein
MTTASAPASTGAAPAPAPVAGTPPAGTPPAPSPAPAPANIGEAPAAPAPAPHQPEAPGTIITYNPTGDAGLDMALGFVGKLGLSPTHPAMAAAQNGDFGMLKAHLASLGDKATGWQQYVALAEQAHATGKVAADAKHAENLALVQEAAGGPEQWTAIQKWAAENAEPHERESVNAALKQGGIAAKAMVQYLAGLYNRAPGTVVAPASATNPAAKAQTSSQEGGALTAAQYAKEVQAARVKLGFNFDGSREYQSLQARREAGRRRGI